MPVEILVCTTCASNWVNGERVGVSGGERLYQYLQTHLANQCPIYPVECLSACSQSCVVAVRAPHKYTYIFGKLPPAPDQLPAVADALALYSELYARSGDGVVGWIQRPDLLKNAVVARLPAPEIVART